jgi:prophage regulatory protein
VNLDDVRLMGTAEIATLLGVTPARVSQLADSRRSGFPNPRWELKAGRIWLAQDVEAWAAKHRPSLAEDSEGS